MCASAAENRQNTWYTGEKPTKKEPLKKAVKSGAFALRFTAFLYKICDDP